MKSKIVEFNVARVETSKTRISFFLLTIFKVAFFFKLKFEDQKLVWLSEANLLKKMNSVGNVQKRILFILIFSDNYVT